MFCGKNVQFFLHGSQKKPSAALSAPYLYKRASTAGACLPQPVNIFHLRLFFFL